MTTKCVKILGESQKQNVVSMPPPNYSTCSTPFGKTGRRGFKESTVIDHADQLSPNVSSQTKTTKVTTPSKNEKFPDTSFERTTSSSHFVGSEDLENVVVYSKGNQMKRPRSNYSSSGDGQNSGIFVNDDRDRDREHDSGFINPDRNKKQKLSATSDQDDQVLDQDQNQNQDQWTFSHLPDDVGVSFYESESIDVDEILMKNRVKARLRYLQEFEALEDNFDILPTFSLKKDFWNPVEDEKSSLGSSSVTEKSGSSTLSDTKDDLFWRMNPSEIDYKKIKSTKGMKKLDFIIDSDEQIRSNIVKKGYKLYQMTKKVKNLGGKPGRVKCKQDKYEF